MIVWRVVVDGKPVGDVVAVSYDVTGPSGVLTFRDDHGPVAVCHRWDYFARIWPLQHKAKEHVPSELHVELGLVPPPASETATASAA